MGIMENKMETTILGFRVYKNNRHDTDNTLVVMLVIKPKIMQ